MVSENYGDKMKKHFIVFLALAALAASAFSGSYSEISGKIADNAAADTTPTPGAADPGAAAKDGERALSDQERFIIGVFTLEGTDLAVTADQADSLVPLWTSMKTYSRKPGQMPAGSSDNNFGDAPAATPEASGEPAQPADDFEEISALFAQIEAVLTTDQLAAIEALELDQEARKAFMEAEGSEMPAGEQPGQGAQTPPAGTPSEEAMPAPDGTPPADGQQPDGAGQPGGERAGFQVASQSLIDALIKLLETK